MHKGRLAIRFLLLGLAVAAVAGTCAAATFTHAIDVSLPGVSYEDGKAALFIEGFPGFGDPGEPVLPIYSFSVLLPWGEDVAHVEVESGAVEEIVLDLPLEWGQPQAPLSMDASWEATQAQASIYEEDRPFPPSGIVHVTTQTYRGYNIAFFRVYPLRYVGAGRRLLCSRRLEVSIETSPSGAMMSRSVGTLRPYADRDISGVQELVDDFSAAGTYASERRLKLLGDLVGPGEMYPVVIITNATLKPAFELLKEHRDSQGLTTRIVTILEVVRDYEGADLQERIRKLIKDAYLCWGTEYVLLGGDDEVIPHRGLYAEILPYVTDNDIPADIYYAALDGTWNDDYDGRWGEPGEDDLLPEVSVGRVAVNTLAEATNFVNKLIRYETAPVTSQIKTAQMAGELIYGEPTWGADEKDEVMNGSSAHGFTTAGFPPSFTVHTLYDRDLYPDTWSSADLIALLNSGRHIVNHAGHCINWSCMKINTSQIPTSFTNDGISNSYMVIYAQGCYSAAFDNRTTDGSYTGDAVAEYFTFIENGAVAYMGNTRYGCGFHGDTRSAAQYYDRQFFDAIFGEGITAVGDAFHDSKVDNIPYIDFRGMRWTYYTVTLIGDPAMDIWTDDPGVLTVTGPEVIRLSENDVAIEVSDGYGPVEGARVSIFSDSTCYCNGFTDASGLVHLDPGIARAGTAYVAVRAHNFYTFLDTVPVADPSGALILVEAVAIDDDATGQSSGNADGHIDAGETIEMFVSLRNVGPLLADQVSGVLRTADPHVTLIDSSGGYANTGTGVATGVSISLSEAGPYAILISGSAYIPLIEPDSTRIASPACVINLLPGCPAHHRLDLEVAISLANGLAFTESTALYVGGLIDEDFEAGSPGWTHTDMVPGFLDQWHLENYRNHTGGGTYCWKFGGAGAGGYAHYAHGALVTPQLCLGTNATLSFWHWIQAELESGNYASDGGIVEISVDGGSTWTQLTPLGSYPHRIYPGTSTPIPPETPCFAWTDVWKEVEFDLSACQGPARIRFNFGGGENFEAQEGWYVDDITVTDDMAIIVLDDEDLEVMPARFALRNPKPNPVISGVTVAFDVPYTSKVAIKVYDIRGRLLDTVADGAFGAGSHSLGWSLPEGQSPGVYFISMRAPGFAETKKVVAR